MGQVQLVGGVGQVQPGGGVRSSQGEEGWVRSSRQGGSGPARGGGVGQFQPAGGVSILRPLAGGMPLAFTQEVFLVKEESDLIGHYGI